MTVSVIIPCYNGREFLAETLESVMAQTFAPLEVIVIDDGSTDDSASIAESFGAPVRVIRQTNQGESVARNRGIDEAKGDWIAFVDADDIWLPEKLERQLGVIDSEDVVAVHTNVEIFGSQSLVSQIELEPAELRYDRVRLAQKNCFWTPSALIVRRANAPQFVEWAQRGEDMLYVLDLVGRGEIRLVTDVMTRYRRHPGGQSANLVGIIDSHKALIQWLEEHKGCIDENQRNAIDEARLKVLIDNAWSMKARRRWDEYWQFREYLNSYRQTIGDREIPGLAAVTDNRILPKFVYGIRDSLFGQPVAHNKPGDS